MLFIFWFSSLSVCFFIYIACYLLARSTYIYIYIGNIAKILRVWDCRNADCPQLVLPGHTNSVTCLQWDFTKVCACACLLLCSLRLTLRRVAIKRPFIYVMVHCYLTRFFICVCVCVCVCVILIGCDGKLGQHVATLEFAEREVRPSSCWT